MSRQPTDRLWRFWRWLWFALNWKRPRVVRWNGRWHLARTGYMPGPGTGDMQTYCGHFLPWQQWWQGSKAVLNTMEWRPGQEICRGCWVVAIRLRQEVGDHAE